MRLVKECDEISHAVATHLRVSGSEADSSAFKSIKAFKSLVLLPAENIEASPLVKTSIRARSCTICIPVRPPTRCRRPPSAHP